MNSMNSTLRRLIGEATLLARSGNLQAATLAIQKALGGVAAPSTPPPEDAARVIDVDAREIPDSAHRSMPHRTPDPTPAAAPTAKHAGEFVSGSYADAHGARAYKLYVPSSCTGHPLPLVVMLHGCTQNPDDFSAGTGMNAEAAQRGFFVLYPAQSQKANASRCWNWFKHNHQQRGRGEPAMLAGMTQEVMKRYAIDRERVYVAGLSAGGAMAVILGDTYPELYAAVGAHSGLARGCASHAAGAFAAMKGVRGEPNGVARPHERGTHPAAGMNAPPTIVFHGDEDSTVHPSNGDEVIAACAGTAARETPQRGRAAGGRSYTRHTYRGAGGRVVAEHWIVHGGGHAWSGGSALGSYTDAKGPAATQEMLRFFFAHPLRAGC